jgi:arylsulfatase A-like enzyme
MTLPNNIVMISVDDLRYDCVSSSRRTGWLEKYGATEVVETPNIDELSEAGTAFHRATSTSSYTPPSHSSIFTGKYPSSHGVKTFFNKLGAHRTIAEFLSEEGYRCRAWIENIALDMLDVTKGFDEVCCPFEDEGSNLFDFVDRTDEGQKNFLFIHLFDVHKPYIYTTGGTERKKYNEDYMEEVNSVLPDGHQVTEELLSESEEEARDTNPNYDSMTESLKGYAKYRSLDYLLRKRMEEDLGEERFMYLVRLYAKGVSEFDTGRFADLISRLERDVLDDYLLMFTSDHGEERCVWGDREDLMNSFNVSEGAVRVPFIVDTDQDSLKTGEKRDDVISHVDILPSVAKEAESGDRPDGTDGEAVLFSQEDNKQGRLIFNESWYYSGGVDFFGNIDEPGEGGLSEIAARRYPYKFVRSFSETGSPEEALYNVEKDAIEQHNLVEEKPEILKNMDGKVDDFLSGVSMDCEPDVGGDSDVM